MSMQAEAGRVAMHLIRVVQNDPSKIVVILPVLAIGGFIYGADKLIIYTKKKKEEKELEELKARLVHRIPGGGTSASGV